VRWYKRFSGSAVPVSAKNPQVPGVLPWPPASLKVSGGKTDWQPGLARRRNSFCVKACRVHATKITQNPEFPQDFEHYKKFPQDFGTAQGKRERRLRQWKRQETRAI